MQSLRSKKPAATPVSDHVAMLINGPWVSFGLLTQLSYGVDILVLLERRIDAV
jgi:hypothetical protein